MSKIDQQFWLDRWTNGETGFHLTKVNPLLVCFYAKIFKPARKVFVPLCGKTLDMTFLASQTNDVLGCELSELAIRQFFDELRVTPACTQLPNASLFRQDRYEIIQGDFFSIDASRFEACRQIYDRAALVALDAETRRAYIAKLRHWFAHADMLLITLDYDQSVMDGPPFAVGAAEVARLFSWANLERLSEKENIDKEPGFASKGLRSFVESAYHIRW